MAIATPFFFFNDTATTEIYTLSLHDALPISSSRIAVRSTTQSSASGVENGTARPTSTRDRKSTRLNSSHQIISYAVFCLKKNKIFRRHRSFRLTGIVRTVCYLLQLASAQRAG